MGSSNTGEERVKAFLDRNIDTVPHLEALLLLWRSRPEIRTVSHVAGSLFVESHRAEEILEDLTALGLAERDTGYRYQSSPEQDQVLTAVDLAYRKELVQVTRTIHAKSHRAAHSRARASRAGSDKHDK